MGSSPHFTPVALNCVTHNIIDIEKIDIPTTVKWGQPATVALQLRNNHFLERPQVECILESDIDALISEPTRKRRSIPPRKTTHMQWTIRPQTLGEQRLRLTLHVEGESLFFDRLPQMNCLASGYFTLEIKDRDNNLKTAFQTSDYFIVEGTFHWTTKSEELPYPPYQMKLQYEDGLIERGYEQGNGVSRWHLQATTPGNYKLELSLVETGQSLPALVKIRSSVQDRLAEIRAAYIYPLEAEIAERLGQVDESLCHIEIKKQPFQVLSPGDFVHEAYNRGEVALWLQGVLAAAHREQWYNLDLLDLVLTYITPIYLPNLGALIPYDPVLASHLIDLHSGQRRYLEYNLLCSEESEDFEIKQNVAAYLLHEKFGHGFFYTQTRLGQQLAILKRHGFPEVSDDSLHAGYNTAVKLIEESALIVNEGFAAWLELTFLSKLDREIRQAASSRRVFLIEQATGMYAREQNSTFFNRFPSRYDSRYREGFEYLEFFSQTFNLRCAVQLVLLATYIDFGITEDVQGDLRFEFEAAEIEQWLLNEEKFKWHSNFRLRDIADLLYESKHESEAKLLIHKQYCPVDCRLHGCPIVNFVTQKLQWRGS